MTFDGRARLKRLPLNIIQYLWHARFGPKDLVKDVAIICDICLSFRFWIGDITVWLEMMTAATLNLHMVCIWVFFKTKVRWCHINEDNYITYLAISYQNRPHHNRSIYFDDFKQGTQTIFIVTQTRKGPTLRLENSDQCDQRKAPSAKNPRKGRMGKRCRIWSCVICGSWLYEFLNLS